MIKSPLAAKPHGHAAARIAGGALLAAVAALAGCGSKEATGPTQVVAKVSGEEITELQVNQALERQPGLKPDQLEPVSRKVVSGLVEQEIVLQKARELKIDRDQRVVQNVEALKREVIARAYLDRIAEGATKPSPKDLQTYFDENPMLFKQRRIYTFQELSAKVSDEQKAGIEAQLAKLKSPAELEAYLKAQQIPTRSERTTAAAENVPLPVLQRVASLKPGQGLIVPANGGIRILLLLGAQDSPVTEEQARPAINAFLMNQRKRQVVEVELASLRKSAKVEYFGKYADLAASAASPGAPASAGTAVAESTWPQLK
ncbi:MAG: peptidyl-prolyl cis-trans isomerase, EpsD family [Rhizobacter sp.]|nr:peptidyl-prolyl cis-trans isomerase, EpsD family [Rhizobacter sp.]